MPVDLPDHLGEVETIEAWHHHVKNKYIGSDLPEQIQGFFAVGGDTDLKLAPAFEAVFNNLGQGYFIFCQ